MTPSIPPLIALGLKASDNIAENAHGIFSAFKQITSRAPKTYKIVMKGTSLLVTLAILLIPPIITNPTIAAKKHPESQPLSAKKLPSPPVIKMNC